MDANQRLMALVVLLARKGVMEEHEFVAATEERRQLLERRGISTGEPTAPATTNSERTEL